MSTVAREMAPPPVSTIGVDDDTSALDAYVRTHPQGSLVHSSGWRSLATDVFGHTAFCLSARGSDGRVQGLLPMVRVRSRWFGDYLVSVPYGNRGGVVADNADVASTLMDAAAALARSLGVAHAEFRDLEPRGKQWPVRTDKVAMVLPLPAHASELWDALGTKLRAQVKRPGREGAVVVRGGMELLGEFYQVFSRNMRDLGTPVYPPRFFAAVFSCFPDKASITVVRIAGRAVAAGFLLRDGTRMEVPWASSLRETNAMGCNMLLYWSLIEQAIETGCREFDFGRSTAGSGTWRFKRQWGAEERQLYWHYWLAPGRVLPRLNPDNARYALAIRLWQRLPLSIANRLGPLVVKGLP